MAFSVKNPKNVATLFAQRDEDEVFLIPDIGLLIYKKDSKDIKLLASPLDFKTIDKQEVIYSSNNFIKRVVVDKSDKKKPIFYIADEAKYLKKGVLDKKEDDIYIKIEKEYFVSTKFDGSKPFTVKGHTLYTKSKVIRLQKRGNENVELNTQTRIAMGLMNKLPIDSEGAFLLQFEYINKQAADDSLHHKRLALAMVPSFTNPCFPVIRRSKQNEETKPIMCEFFFYSDLLKEEFVVYISQSEDGLTLEFFHLNGQFLCAKDFKVKGQSENMRSFDFHLSNNGKYLLIYECYLARAEESMASSNAAEQENSEQDDEERAVKAKKQKEKRSWDKIEAAVYEIVLVRPKSSNLKVKELYNKLIEKIHDQETRNRYIRKHAFSNVIICELKKIRKVEHLEERCDLNCFVSVTDVGTVTAFRDFTKNGTPQVWYENKELSDFILRKALKQKKESVENIKDYKWLAIKSGFIFFNSQQAYFLNIKVKLGKEEIKEGVEAMTSEAEEKSITKIDFQVGTTDLSIQGAYECNDKTKVVFRLSNNHDGHLFLVWDLQENKEISNYSTIGRFKYVLGNNSSSGYLLQNCVYVNLDDCLPFRFIEHDFTQSTKKRIQGFKVNRTEELVAFNQNLLLKTTYSHVAKLNSHLKKSISFEEGKFSLEDLKFSVDNNTVLHLYALNDECLMPIVEYLKEKAPHYLSAIMIKNSNGNTPLELAYNYKNSMTLRILLLGLASLGQDHVSRKFYDKFPDMIVDGLKSFQEYIETCFFQTIQMKSMQYLSMKDDSAVVLASHNSCVLSEEFLQGHLNITPEEKELKEEQMRLQERKDKYDIKKTRVEAKERALKRTARKKKQIPPSRVTIGRGGTPGINVNPNVGKPNIQERSQDFEESIVGGESSDEYYSSEEYDSNSYEDEESEYSDDESYDSEYDSEFSPVNYDGGSDEEEDKYNNIETAVVRTPASPFENKGLLDRDKLDIHLDDIKLQEEGKLQQILAKKPPKLKPAEKVEKQKIALKTEKEELDKVVNDFEKKSRDLYERTKQSMKKYEVNAIEFSWLFKPNPRKKFLTSLAKSKDIEIFSLEIIQMILLFLWKYYKKVISLFVLLPFLLYFVVFILYATWIQQEKEDEEETNGSYHAANLALIIIILINIAINIILELNKMMYSIIEYFTSFWCLLNMCSLILNSFVVIADLAGLQKRDLIPVLAVAVLLMWCKLFYFGRIFLSTAWMVRMIYSIFVEIVYFLLVLGIMVLGFANTFYIIARINDSGFAGDNFWRSIIFSYLNALGAFALDDFPKSGWSVYTKAIWLFSVFIIFLVLLNMLIAIINDIFAKVHEKMNNNLLKELTRLMLDNNWAFRLFPFFKGKEYIITFKQEQGEIENTDETSRVSAMKRDMEKIVMEAEYDSAYQDLLQFHSEKVEQRGVSLEASTNVYFASLREKFEQYEEQMNQHEEIFKELEILLGKAKPF